MSARLETSDGLIMLTCVNGEWKEETPDGNGMLLNLLIIVLLFSLRLLPNAY